MISQLFFYNNESTLLKTLQANWINYANCKGFLTTRKLRSCLPTLKSSFDRDLLSHVVDEIKCNGCGSIYVGQTSRQVTTRITEHQKKDSQVCQHLVECRGAMNDIERKILDACRTVEKLMIIETIYISKLISALNTRDENRGVNLR